MPNVATFHSTLFTAEPCAHITLLNFLYRQFKQEGLPRVTDKQIYDQGIKILQSLHLSPNEMAGARNILKRYLGMRYYQEREGE
jgi:hypothetical protein